MWDFNNLSAEVREGKVYTKDGKIYLEVTPVFIIGEDWMSFPLSSPIKFSSDGEVSGVEGQANVDLNIEKVVSFKGTGTLYFDTDYNFKVELSGKMKLIKKKLKVDGYFLFHHRTHEFDYWRISGSVTGLKVPLDSQGTVLAREFSGGFFYNMKVEVNDKDFSLTYSPEDNKIGVYGGIGISTADNYITYVKGSLSLELNDLGLEGGIARIIGKAWLFDKKHSGDPPFRALIEGSLGDNSYLYIKIQGGKIKLKRIVEIPKGGTEYRDIVLYVDKNGLTMDVGTSSSPWSAKVFSILSGSAYFHLDLLSQNVKSNWFYSASLNLSKSEKIKACKFSFRGNLRLTGRGNIQIVPNLFYYEHGFLSFYLKGEAKCPGFKILVEPRVVAEKEISAPEPWKFYLGINYDVPEELEKWFFLPDKIKIGVDVLKLFNEV